MKLPRIFNRRKNMVSVESIDDILLKALLKGEEITKDEALALPVVASSVDLICDMVAMIPIKLYKEEDGVKTEIKDDIRVKLLNKDTKDTLDGFQFKKAIVEDYLLEKGGYAYINKMRNNIKSLNYVEAKKITINTNQKAIFKNYSITVDEKEYKPFDFIKILRNSKDGASGTSLITQVSKAIETTYQTMLYQLALVKTGGNKRGFIKSKNRLSKETMEELKQGWKNLYKNNSTNAVILNEGLEFQESSNSSVEMQMNENKTTLNNEIRAIFHIKDKFSDTFKEAIQPILSAIECALNRDLLLEKEKDTFFFSFDTKAILRGDLKERFEAYKIAKETGWITENEIRYLEDYDAIDGLDIISMSLGSVIYDTKKKEYYTPNTNSSKSFEKDDKNKGGDESE